MLEPHSDGWILVVRAQPGASRNEVRGLHDGVLKVSVTQNAEKGKANAALRTQLAESLRLKKSQVQLISGQTATQKKFLVRDIDRDELQARIMRLCELS